MINGGMWLMGLMQGEHPGDEERLVYMCQRCRAVCDWDYHVCPKCGLKMIGMFADGGEPMMKEDAVIQLADAECSLSGDGGDGGSG